MPDNTINSNNLADSSNNSNNNGNSNNQSSNLEGITSESSSGWETVNTSTSPNMISLQIEKSDDLDKILKLHNFESKKLAG